MTDYTPGPWVTSRYNTHISAHGKEICKFESKHGLYDNWSANAELIASAPRLKEERDELLEVVKLCKLMTDAILPNFNFGDSWMDAKSIDLLNRSCLAIDNIIAKVEK